MSLPASNAPHFSFGRIEQKLREEIAQLREAQAKVNPHSDDPGEKWVYPVYERIIERRMKLLECLSA